MIVTRQGKGSFVADALDATRALAFAEFQTHLKGLLDAAGKLGLDRQDLIDRIDQALAGPQDASPSTTEPTHRRTPA